MDEHKKVRVTMNQQTNNHRKHDLEHFLTPKPKQNSYSFNFRGRSMFGKMIKPIILAILLGGIFGAGLIYFFSDLTPDAIPVTTIDSDNEENEDDQDTNNVQDPSAGIQVQSNTFDVVQFGLFSSEENANELIQTSLEPDSIPAVIQEQNGQFFVISHVLNSESEKDTVTQYLESLELEYMTDFFYKTWSYDSFSINVNDEDKEWMNQGLTLLNDSSNKEAWMNQTKDWLDQAPDTYQSQKNLVKIRESLTGYQNSSNSNLKEFHLGNTVLNLNLFFSNLN